MSRMYYTDPLKAAWMAREFGVKYHDTLISPVELTVPDLMDEIRDNLVDGTAFDNLYIHPDSYSVFEPQEGDVVTVSNLVATIGSISDKTTIWGKMVSGKGVRASFYDSAIDNTIQRNNKAFFMPEVEDD